MPTMNAQRAAHHLVLTCLLAVGGAVAACGGPAQPPAGPSVPSTPGTGASMPPTTGPAAGPDGGATSMTPSAAADGGAPGATAAAGAAFTGPMKPVIATTMTADLQAIGVDAKSLPPLPKMPPATLRKVMRTFTKALGAKCTDCHNESDYAAPTPMKKVAAGMWDHFVREMAMSDGTPVYCDSCHQGRMKILDRHDKKALGKWMDDNFVGKLARRDKKDMECATCHGDPFEGDILGKWAK